MRPVQKFSQEYLRECQKMSPVEILDFLESFRLIHETSNEVRTGAPSASSKSKLISIKIPEALLTTFRQKAAQSGFKYQTQIKRLMEAWIKS